MARGQIFDKSQADVFVILIALLFGGAIANTIRGATPELALKLRNGVNCIPVYAPVGAKASHVKFDRINDNFCDCRNGEDEPGTSACATGKFWCVNSGYRGQFIPSSRVDDGVCDCCDGSDEPGGKCMDKCKQLGKEARKEAESTAAKIMQGVRIRRKYAVQAQSARVKDKREVSKLKREVEDVSRQIDKIAEHLRMLKARQGPESPSEDNTAVHDPHEENDWEGSEGNKEEDDDSNYDKNDEGENEGRPGEDTSRVEKDASENENSEADAAFDDTKDDEKENESLLNERTSEEVTVADSVHSDSSDSNTSQDIQSSDRAIELICEELSGEKSSFLARKLRYAYLSFTSTIKGAIPRPLQRFVRGTNQKLSECVERAESLKGQLESKKYEAEERLRELQKKLGINYGSDGALRQLHGKCVKTKVTQYEFEHCLFNMVQQYESGSMIATLGRFDALREESGIMSMMYKDGDQCWNGPQRSISVLLECGVDDSILSVDEPSRCSYSMRFATPAACTEAAAKKVLAEISFSSNSSTQYTETKEEL